jgi:uncharacterized membrane protein YqaE (UPF0057 family)
MKRFYFLSLFCLLTIVPNLVSATLPAPAPTPWTEAFRTHWKSRTPAERKELKQSIKTEIRNFQKAKKQGRAADTNTLLLVLISLILPPLAVYLHQGEINSKFWISLLLTLLIWVPGVIYALLVIFGVVN